MTCPVPAIVVGGAPPSFTCPCSLFPCIPCSYPEIAIESLSTRSGGIGSACVEEAKLSALKATIAATNGIMASGTVTASTYTGNVVSAAKGALAGITTSGLTVESLILNGVSSAPDVLIIDTVVTNYTVPAGFSNQGAIVNTALAGDLRLPAGQTLPVGYAISVYNLGSFTIVARPSLADPGAAFFGLFDVAATVVNVSPGRLVRFVWTGESWFIWT